MRTSLKTLLPPAWREAVLLIVLVGTTVAVYWPVRSHPFISLDDRPYVVDNPHITHLNWETVKWSFTSFRGANWFPLTWLSHALDYHLFSLRAGRHHDTNLLLHVFNALLLFWILMQATGYLGRSWMVATLFALHPINVETVAWIAERKNLLSMLFFLLALGAYYAYARKPRVGSYLVVVVLFVLGLMCKPQIVTLPFVLLLWDFWPLERVAVRSSLFASRQNGSHEVSGEQRMANSEERSANAISTRSFSWLVLEKVPLLALSAASAIVTMKAQRAGGTIGGAVNTFSLASRLGNAIVAYMRYLGDAIWPAHLAFFYPHARTSSPVWQLTAAVAFLLGITVLTLANRSRRYFAIGWLWFLGTLIPMIGLVQVGSQAMADRYAYLPFVGLFLAACWGLADLAEQRRFSRIWLPAGAITILLLLALATRRQLNYWSDDLTLWTHSAEVVHNNYLAENMIGETLLLKGEPEAAIAHFRASAAMEPLFTFSHEHIGIYEEEHRHPHAAIEQFQQVLDLTEQDPRAALIVRTTALVHMSYAYNQLGDYAKQEKYVEMAARLQQP